MCVSGEVANYLIACDAHADGPADGFASHFPGDHVGIAGYEACEKLENGDLEIGRGVGVDAVVGFDNDEASIGICRGSEGRPKATGVGSKCCGQTGWIEVSGVRIGLVDNAEIAKVL